MVVQRFTQRFQIEIGCARAAPSVIQQLPSSAKLQRKRQALIPWVLAVTQAEMACVGRIAVKKKERICCLRH